MYSNLSYICVHINKYHFKAQIPLYLFMSVMIFISVNEVCYELKYYLKLKTKKPTLFLYQPNKLRIVTIGIIIFI